MENLNFASQEDVKPILSFLCNSQVSSEEDMIRVADLAEELSYRLSEGESFLASIVDYMVTQVVEWEENELKRLAVTQPDDVAIVNMLMEAQELSITSLAKDIDMQRTVLSEILNKKKNRQFTKKQLEALAKYFDIDIAVFFN